MIFFKQTIESACKQWLILFSLFFIANSLHAEMAHGVGEYLYGPDTSESKACELAQDKAKSMALISVMGDLLVKVYVQILDQYHQNHSDRSDQLLQ